MPRPPEGFLPDLDALKERVLAGGPNKLREDSPYGSAFRRAARSARKAKDAFIPHIPWWFLDRNVQLHETLSAQPNEVAQVSSTSRDRSLFEKETREWAQSPPSPESSDARPSTAPEGVDGTQPPKRKYEVDWAVMREISSFVQAGLQASSSPNQSLDYDARRHLVLQSPKGGGSLFLEAVVRDLARTHDADLISLNAQDIAEIASDPVVDLPSHLSHTLSRLGYQTHIIDPESDPQNEESGDGLEGLFGDLDENSSSPRIKPVVLPFGKLKKHPAFSKASNFPLADILKSATSLAGPAQNLPNQPNQPLPHMMVVGRLQDENMAGPPESNEAGRANAIVNAFLNAPRIKESAEQPGSVNISLAGHVPVANENQSTLARTRLIVMVQDYLELCSSGDGSAVINMLHQAVNQRRANGQEVLIIGTSSSEDLVPSLTKDGFKNIQTDPNPSYQTIVTPCANRDAESLFTEDEKARVLGINYRHMLDMLRRIAPEPESVRDITSRPRVELTTAEVFNMDLSFGVWSYEQVYRVASVALGQLHAKQSGSAGRHPSLTIDDLKVASSLVEFSDNAKFKWVRKANEQGSQAGVGETKANTKKAQDERMKRLRESCNKHEKRLLGGVVDAQSIRTSFAQVHAPPETIEALKTSTTLSLIRPDAFTYGVLASDKLSGLLLYGPPGTGKTLLAKAVAKESGATVLEVSGSDVYDKYVGEGEKNVRAIFTLAAKLSPCVVFIDEADAILGARSGAGSNRTSHRELINQFLREWDGLTTDKSAFLMVATNRPFDLDDAVLRRLPRRLLVDLPTEADRASILRLHLRDEALAPDVALADLAARTPLYSGSDLKNLCIAAALACVREENAHAAARGIDTSKPQSPAPRLRIPPLVDERGRFVVTGHEDPTVQRRRHQLNAMMRPGVTQDEFLDELERRASDTEDDELQLLKDGGWLASNARLRPGADDAASTTMPVFPLRRTLTRVHFETALAEISASISEDMSSLAAIRKFDERYGDRRGRRKKLGGGYGFGMATAKDRERAAAEEGRVRTKEVGNAA